MSRPRKAIVDYFPHYVNHGKTMFTIENKYGNDGYACWFKVLELLGASEHHFIDCNDIETWEFLLAKTRVNENTAISILDTCAKLGAIDQELWNNKIVRSHNFIENLSSVYNRREVSLYSKEDVLSFCRQKSNSLGVTSNKYPQSKVKDNLVDESEGEETRAEERIVKENPKPNPEPDEKAEIQDQRKSRARAQERKTDNDRGEDALEQEPDGKVIDISAPKVTEKPDQKEKAIVSKQMDEDW